MSRGSARSPRCVISWPSCVGGSTLDGCDDACAYPSSWSTPPGGVTAIGLLSFSLQPERVHGDRRMRHAQHRDAPTGTPTKSRSCRAIPLADAASEPIDGADQLGEQLF